MWLVGTITVAAVQHYNEQIGKCITRLQTDTKAHWPKQIIVKPALYFWARFSDSGRVQSCFILYYIIDGDNTYSQTDTCEQLIYIPPQQGKLRNPIEGCLEIGLNHLISPLKRYITVHSTEGWQAMPRRSLHRVVMEPPSSLLWRPPVAAVPNIAVIVRRALLQTIHSS